MNKGIRIEFGALVAFGMVLCAIYFTVYISSCGPHQNHPQETAQEQGGSNHLKGNLVSPQQANEKGQTKYRDEAADDVPNNSMPLICSAKPTDTLLVLFSYYLVVVGWIAIRSAEKLTHGAERGILYVEVTGHNIGNVQHDLMMPLADGIDYTSQINVEAHFRFVNYGKTPVIIKTVSSELRLLSAVPPEPQYFVRPFENKSSIIASGRAYEPEPAFLNSPIDTGTWQGLLADNWRVWFYGRVTYADIFDVDHEYRFLLSYGGSMTFFVPDYNRRYNQNT